MNRLFTFPPAAQSSIDTVVLDVGNVLERFDPDFFLRTLVPDRAMREALTGRIFSTPVWLMLDRGIVDEEEAAQRFCQGHPDWLMTVRHLLFAWPELMHPFPHTLRMLEALRAAGYRLLLLSNYHARAFDVVPWHKALRQMVDGVLLSAEVRLLKPDPSIFHRLCARFAVTPGRALFIDDSAANVEAALYVGFHATVYEKPEDVAAALQALALSPLAP